MEKNQDKALRPRTFREFVGQDHAKPNLEVFVNSARSRHAAMDHLLLAGPPGLGKTTLSEIVANELGTRMVYVFAPSIKTKGQLCSILAGLKDRDILFIDEIHSLENDVEELLYPAMEDYYLRFVSNNIPVNIKLAPFTLIGATTRAGQLQQPLRDRFGIVVEMQPYSDAQLSQIVKSSAKKLEVAITDGGALELARRTRGVPRAANKLLRRVRDFAIHDRVKEINEELVRTSCDKLGVDGAGLEINMVKYLTILHSKRVPCAVKTMTSLLGESLDTVENVIEPFLMSTGFIEKTPKGRILTSDGHSHLKTEGHTI